MPPAPSASAPATPLSFKPSYPRPSSPLSSRGLTMEFQPKRAGTSSHATLPASWILLPPSPLSLPSSLPFFLPPIKVLSSYSVPGFVLAHMHDITNGKNQGGAVLYVIFRFLLYSFVWQIFFSPSEHAGQVPRTQFKRCFAR